MSDIENEVTQDEIPEQPTERDLLKQQADLMGIKYSPNIGVAKLKEKIEAKKAGESEKQDPNLPAEAYQDELDTIEEAEQYANANTGTVGRRPTPQQLKLKRKQDATRLVRCRVTCMNPVKNAMQGDIFSVGNGELGFTKKYIAFGVPWHIPNIILNVLKNKKYMTHYQVADPRRPGKKIKRNKLVPEFAIEILDPLTPKQFQELRQRQIIQQGGGEE